jgi:hypothetical protein
MIDNTSLGRSGLSNARKASTSTLRTISSNASLGSDLPISAAQVVQLAREAMKNAVEENRTKAAEASGVSNELKPGVTIDLSHMKIQKFPDEVVDIIKTELERYCWNYRCLTYRY